MKDEDRAEIDISQCPFGNKANCSRCTYRESCKDKKPPAPNERGEIEKPLNL